MSLPENRDEPVEVRNLDGPVATLYPDDRLMILLDDGADAEQAALIATGIEAWRADETGTRTLVLGPEVRAAVVVVSRAPARTREIPDLTDLVRDRPSEVALAHPAVQPPVGVETGLVSEPGRANRCPECGHPLSWHDGTSCVEPFPVGDRAPCSCSGNPSIDEHEGLDP